MYVRMWYSITKHCANINCRYIASKQANFFIQKNKDRQQKNCSENCWLSEKKIHTQVIEHITIFTGFFSLFIRSSMSLFASITKREEYLELYYVHWPFHFKSIKIYAFSDELASRFLLALILCLWNFCAQFNPFNLNWIDPLNYVLSVDSMRVSFIQMILIYKTTLRNYQFKCWKSLLYFSWT